MKEIIRIDLGYSKYAVMLMDLAINYRNEFLTIEKMAEYMGIPEDALTAMINSGEELQEEYAKTFKRVMKID